MCGPFGGEEIVCETRPSHLTLIHLFNHEEQWLRRERVCQGRRLKDRSTCVTFCQRRRLLGPASLTVSGVGTTTTKQTAISFRRSLGIAGILEILIWRAAPPCWLVEGPETEHSPSFATATADATAESAERRNRRSLIPAQPSHTW